MPFLSTFKKYPAILALIIQIISAAAVLLLIRFVHLQVFYTVVIQGILASGLAIALKMSRWWIVISLFFGPLVLFISAYQVPQWIYFLCFIVLLLINGNSIKDRVPLYLTGNETIKKIEEVLRVQYQNQASATASAKASPKSAQVKSFTFIDLGSGLAGTLLELSKVFPQAKFYGVETAPLVFVASWLRTFLTKNCQIRFCSIWKTELSKYDVVYCFLSPVPMPKIWEKAKAEMKKGSMLISNSFEIPGVKPTQTIELKDWRDSKIFIWKI
jgi:hypothetical protein